MRYKRIVYGNANYADLVQKSGYFVDKTPYIAKLELVENPVYLRLRRFGKSTFCSLLTSCAPLSLLPQHCDQR